MPLKSAPKILQIFSRYHDYGGEEGSVYRIGNHLQSHYDVGTFIHSSDALFGDPLTRGVAALQAFHNWQVVRRLRSYQELGGYDLWMIHNVFPAMSPSVYKLAFMLGVPVVQYLHNYRMGCVNGFLLNHGEPCERCIRGNFFPALQTACWHESHLQSGIMGVVATRNRLLGVLKKINHWIAISEAQRQVHISMGIPEENITTIPHYYEAKVEHFPYPVAGDVVFVGRLSREKGVDRILDAWADVQHLGRTLKIVGDGPERTNLEQIVSTRALKNVVFTGFLAPEKMHEIWESAACSVVPSIWKEPFGMVVMEAWAKKRPVIAHRIGALPEIITEGSDGLLVTPNHPRELAVAMLSILQNPDQGRDMGERGHLRLKTQYNKSRWITEVNNVFKKALSKKP